MSDGKGQQEPSMEEILASIRRIISEDAEPAAPARAAEKPAASAAGAGRQADDILTLSTRADDDFDSPMSLDMIGRRADPAPKAGAKPAASSPLDDDDDDFGFGDLASLSHDDDDDHGFGDIAQQMAALDDRPRPAPKAPSGGGGSLDAGLTSAATAAAAGAAFGRLGGGGGSSPAMGAGPLNGDMLLSEFVRQALEPLLREWMDRNLPGMVEELVQAEIQRLSQNGGRR